MLCLNGISTESSCEYFLQNHCFQDSLGSVIDGSILHTQCILGIFQVKTCL